MSNDELPLSNLIGRSRGTKRHVTDERLDLSHSNKKKEQENETIRQENAKLKNQLKKAEDYKRRAEKLWSQNLEKETKLVRLRAAFRQENAKLKNQLKHKCADYKRMAGKLWSQNLEKETELVRLRADLCQLENTLACPPTPSTSAPETEDVMANLKDIIENEFSCCICTEVLIDSTTLHCGHTF